MREFLFFVASIAGAAVLTALAVVLDPKSPVWFWLLWGGSGVFALCALALVVDMVLRWLKAKKSKHKELGATALKSEFSEHIPDIRLADYPAALALFEGQDADKLLPLLEAEKIDSWGRPMGIGEPPPTKLTGAIWKTHYLQFLPSGAQWTRNQTFLKAKNGHKSDYYDIFFNRTQLQKVWPTLRFIEAPSRISLYDFVHVEAIKVGWERDGADVKKGFMSLLARLEQAAVDELVHFFGKKTADVEDLISSPLVPIPPIYWHDHEIDVIATIYHPNNENFSKRRLIPHAKEERFFDLHLNRREALNWLERAGRP